MVFENRGRFQRVGPYTIDIELSEANRYIDSHEDSITLGNDIIEEMKHYRKTMREIENSKKTINSDLSRNQKSLESNFQKKGSLLREIITQRFESLEDQTIPYAERYWREDFDFRWYGHDFSEASLVFSPKRAVNIYSLRANIDTTNEEFSVTSHSYDRSSDLKEGVKKVALDFKKVLESLGLKAKEDWCNLESLTHESGGVRGGY